MDTITQRQKEILIAIINEFMKNAEEVGSISLVDKYDLGVSSATIRNEMMRLMEMGFLKKSHISSGRYPTDQALRFYVQNISDGKTLTPIASVEISQGVFRERFSKEKLLKSLHKIVSEQCKSPSFTVFNDDIRYFGLSELFRYEELKDIDVMERLVNILEDDNYMLGLLEKYKSDGVSLLIGSESGINDLRDCVIAFTQIPFWNGEHGYLGVLGSKRIQYSKVIPTLREVKLALQNSLKGWG